MRTVYGVGVFDGHIVVKDKHGTHPAYMKWMAMLGRCYSPCQQERDPCYHGVTVCEEWKLFSNFYTWLKTWDNWENLELDKDIIGGRVYSPATCLLVTGDLNKFLAYRVSKRSHGTMVGFYYEKDRKKYKAHIKVDGRIITLGRFDTELEAHLCWLKAKAEQLTKFFETEDQRVVPHLKTLYNDMLEHIEQRKEWTR
ncbi:HNH endonuclease [Escherichia phage iGC_PHA_EC001]|nr:HNH endonuclease [Escherichia phage iGC_PHA_EC001]